MHTLRGPWVMAYPLVVFLLGRCFCNSQKMAKTVRFFSEKFRHNFLTVFLRLVYQNLISSYPQRCATCCPKQVAWGIDGPVFFLMTKICRKIYFFRIFSKIFRMCQFFGFSFDLNCQKRTKIESSVQHDIWCSFVVLSSLFWCRGADAQCSCAYVFLLPQKCCCCSCLRFCHGLW